MEPQTKSQVPNAAEYRQIAAALGVPVHVIEAIVKEHARRFGAKSDESARDGAK